MEEIEITYSAFGFNESTFTMEISDNLYEKLEKKSRNGNRNEPGDHDRTADKAAAAKLVTEKQREKKTDDKLEEDRGNGEYKSVFDRTEHLLINIGKKLNEICKPDIILFFREVNICNINILHAQYDIIKDRISDKEQQKHESGCNKKISHRHAAFCQLFPDGRKYKKSDHDHKKPDDQQCLSAFDALCLN